MANILDLTKARQVKLLGAGADGVARLFSKGRGKYVVKTLKIFKGKVVDMNSAEELENERNVHLGLWARLRPDEKQYFFEPYIAQLNPEKYPGPNHTMNFIPGLEEARTVGYDLYQKTKEGNAQDVLRLKNFIRKIQKGVLAMWRTGMVHADLHLGNILCSKDASIVKIIDFGRSGANWNRGLNITKNNLTTNKLRSPPQAWRNWWSRAIINWDKEWRNVYGAGNPEGYILGFVNRNRFYHKPSFNQFKWYRTTVNHERKFRTIPKPKPKPTTPSKKKSPPKMVPIVNIVKKEERALPRLVDRIAAIARKARAQRKKEALDRINKEYKDKKKECKKVAKQARNIRMKEVDKKFGLTPELRRRAQAQANKVQRMVAVRKAFVKVAQARKNLANRKAQAAAHYGAMAVKPKSPPKARKTYSKLVVLSAATKKAEREARKKMTEAQKKENDRRKARRAYEAKKAKK